MFRAILIQSRKCIQKCGLLYGRNMIWKIQLEGESIDLEELSKVLVSDDIKLIESNGTYYLLSSSFEEFENEKEVRKLAQNYAAILTGASLLNNASSSSIKVTSVIQCEEDGRNQIISHELSDTVELRDTLEIQIEYKDGSTASYSSADPISSWVKASFSDKVVANALMLLGRKKNNWDNLYRLFEIIEDDVGGSSQIIENCWSSNKSLRRFKHSANSPSVSGDDSRHGKEQNAPPANPMSLEDAQEFIYGLLNQWLKSKE